MYGREIVPDRAKRILVITGIGSTPCPLEGLKSTLDSITLNQGWYHTVRVPFGIDTIQYSGVLYGIA